jgi:aspartyl aminopeptidase
MAASSTCSVSVPVSESVKTAAQSFLDYVNASPSPFHAVGMQQALQLSLSLSLSLSRWYKLYMDWSVNCTTTTTTAEASSLLEEKGFSRLNERSEWNLKVGQAYYVVRNQSSLIAFVVGGQYVCCMHSPFSMTVLYVLT